MSQKRAVGLAILAAALYGISSPVSKGLLEHLPPTLMAALLYLGAGLGMLLVNLSRSIATRPSSEARLTRRELPFILGMILLDIAAPVFLMLALTLTTAANVSLLNNFEIVATTLIALAIFREAIGRTLWVAITLITTASFILSFEDLSSLSFSIGSLFAILACLCWGFENNFTRKLSLKDPMQIVVIKGLGSGTGALILAVAMRQVSTDVLAISLALLLGFVAYGLSIYFYVSAQRTLGAARTSAYYAIAPFIGVLLSIILYGQPLSASFVIALAIMLLGAFFAAIEHHKHAHWHEPLAHDHRHHHHDGHHTHSHDRPDAQDPEHSHFHTHEAHEHTHRHTPDTHHQHNH
ncbi:MAG: DMT family transporter [Eubacteriales bacterium]|nr:DMT family transporter [Eubacteriales bacterium]